jgi:hypothetical protein
MHVSERPKPHTHTACGLRFPPQYPNLNSEKPQGPKKKETRYVSKTKASKYPVREHPPCSPTGSLWREMFRLQSQWFIHSFIAIGVPKMKRKMRRKRTVTIHGPPRGRKAYIQLGAAWFSKGIVNDTAITTPVPCSLQHETFHFGLGRPEAR